MGDKPLDWVKARNAESAKELAAAPDFAATKAGILEVLDSPARIPGISKAGDWYYNFWKDAANPKGLWRRTSLAEYRKPTPKWETVLDLDALGKAENEGWVWKGARLLRAGGFRLALLSLSRGGADATVTREFDVQAKAFVKDGFTLAESKGSVAWIDADSIYVATDFGPDSAGVSSMTTSGYPRIVKRWQRGTPLTAAETVYAGKAADMAVSAYYDDTKGFERHFVQRRIEFYKSETFWRAPDKSLRKVEVPDDAESDVHHQWLLVHLRTPWTVNGKAFGAGDLIAAPFDDVVAGQGTFQPVFQAAANRTLASYSPTQRHLILNILEDVKSLVTIATPAGGAWKQTPLPGTPPLVTASAAAVDPQESDAYFLTVSGYLTPSSLLHGTVLSKPAETLKQLPAFFDASGLQVAQHFATSQDGTKVPYFEVAAKSVQPSGANPTLLYGYGGFEISLVPNYSGVVGRSWLAKGGVHVVANIRGGGEYGPRWHQAALQKNRLRAYEDFAAVAQDLVTRKVTSARHLGIQGGSNGGLLVGNMLALYPHLFGAVVCQVPLLDMQRYSHLLAGASWMAEYGDPDVPEQWQFIQTYSPYHTVKAGTTYPPLLLMTSTRDDRVHPGHARKFMAKLAALGQDVRYYENIEGGHGGSANNEQAAHMAGLAYTFLRQKLR